MSASDDLLRFFRTIPTCPMSNGGLQGAGDTSDFVRLAYHLPYKFCITVSYCDSLFLPNQPTKDTADTICRPVAYMGEG
jgi:hypothetical protein